MCMVGLLLLALLPAYAAALDLLDDDLWTKAVQAKEAENAGESLIEQFQYDMELCDLYFSARSYDKAAVRLEKWQIKLPNYNLLYSNLSVAYGKLGRYAEAKAMAEKAIASNPHDAMHGRMVLASWEWCLGDHDTALATEKSVESPAPTDKRYGFYQACVACFYASVGDKAQIGEAIKQSLKNDLNGHSLNFFKRDVVFDPYRNDEWFVALVGKTLK